MTIELIFGLFEGVCKSHSFITVREVARKESYSALTRRDLQMQPRRALRGHTGKVHALHWSTDSRHIVSVSQDNKMIVWNAFNSVKQLVVPLRSKWIATCAFSPSGRQVAAGGFGGSCSVYRVGVCDSLM
jgi:guanine nucleotide-binding protein G(I)/G(S)/G(T) subunit beta-1